MTTLAILFQAIVLVVAAWHLRPEILEFLRREDS